VRNWVLSLVVPILNVMWPPVVIALSGLDVVYANLTLLLSSALVGWWLERIASRKLQLVVALIGPLAYLGWWVWALQLFDCTMPKCCWLCFPVSATLYAQGAAPLIGAVAGYACSSCARYQRSSSV